MPYAVTQTGTAEENAVRMVKELKTIQRTMMDVVREAAVQEHTSKRYRNRTYNLINSTESLLTEVSEDLVTVELAMDAHYASYVADKFDLSDFREIGDLAIDVMTEALEDII